MSIDQVFDEMEVEADPFALCELRGRCEMGLGRRATATVHYVIGGVGEIRCLGQRDIKAQPGTLAVIPALQSHSLFSHGERGRPLAACRPAEVDLVRHLKTGVDLGEGGGLIVVCSEISVGLRGVGDLVDLVRHPIVASDIRETAIAHTLDALLLELCQPKLGSKAMIRALLMQCVIDLFRRRWEDGDRALHWMAALGDERLWAALRAMLDNPGGLHTVESLAEVAGTSRSTFAQRFSAAYGNGPMALLRDLRMTFAGSLLAQSNLPVKRVAELAGFQSRSAFTRTFESTTGLTPRQFRLTSRGKEPPRAVRVSR